MYFSAAASSENAHGSMNLVSNTASLPSIRPSKVAAIQRSAGWRILFWMSVIACSVLASVPAPIEVLGRKSELNQEIAGQVLRLDFSPLLAPKADKSGCIAPHDDPAI
jgi:hypothetical protein